MEIHYRRHLKKLNKNDINEKIKKKYGKKNIEVEYEKKVKEAIDNLKNKNKYSNNISDIEKNQNDFSIKNTKKIFQINSDIDKYYLLNSNLNNECPLNQNNNIINNNIKVNNDNNFNNNINKEKNIVNIGNENQNFFDSLAIYPLNQEFHQNDFFQQNKIDNLFNKERNYINIDISNSITRPCSKSNLCMNKKPDNIFAKDEDLFSDEEDFSQGNNNYKNINDNSYMSDNYDFLDNKQNYKNEIGINNFNYNFNEINEANNSLKYQGQLEFLDKNYII